MPPPDLDLTYLATASENEVVAELDRRAAARDLERITRTLAASAAWHAANPRCDYCRQLYPPGTYRDHLGQCRHRPPSVPE